MRCKFQLCQICTQELAVTPNEFDGRHIVTKASIQIQADLVHNKCPKCKEINARRPWYPPILHALEAPLNFVGSQLLLPTPLKRYAIYLVTTAFEICPDTFEVTNTL